MTFVRRPHLALLVFLIACTNPAFEPDQGDTCDFDGDLSAGIQGDLQVDGDPPSVNTAPGTSVVVTVKLTGVKVTDAGGSLVGGRLLCGKEIRWTPGVGSGTVAPTLALTDTSGLVWTTWVLPTAELATATLTAEVVNSIPLLRVVFTTKTTLAPAIALSVAKLRYDAELGGVDPPSQFITITNSGFNTLSNLSIGPIRYGPFATGWLQPPTLNVTTAPATLTVRPVTGRLQGVGFFTATVPVLSDVANNSPQDLIIEIVVVPTSTPSIALLPATLMYSAVQGGANPASKSIAIGNDGGGTLSGLSIGTIIYGAGATGWLQTPTLNATTGPTTLMVQPVTGTLAPGTYTATVPVQSTTASNSPQNLAITLVVAAPACSTIQDQFGADGGWSETATTSGNTPTQSVSFQVDGGNPDGYRQMKHFFAGAGTISVYHYYQTTTYNPSMQGAIDYINYSEDQKELNPLFLGAAVGTGFSMMQGGTRYNIILRSPSGAFTNTAWETTSAVLRASDFSGVNFTATGGPITFGYFRSNSSGGGTNTVTHGIDNWKVEVCR
jgi:hypothetical protein